MSARADGPRGGQRRWAGTHVVQLRTWIHASLVGLVLLGLSTSGHAELLMEGSREQVLLKADRVPLANIIAALSGRFNMALKSAVPLDVVVDGRYSGPLTEVLGRLLRSYDFVLSVGKTRDSPLSIIVLGHSNRAAIVPSLVRLRASVDQVPVSDRIPVAHPGDGGM